MALLYSSVADETAYPPLPVSGPPEDSELAEQNYLKRERISKSWAARLLPINRSNITPLKRRTGSVSSDSTRSSASIDISRSTSIDSFKKSEGQNSKPSGPSLAIQAVDSADVSDSAQLAESSRPVRPTGPSRDTVRISLTNIDEDPTRDEHLYCWAMIYENQRGVSVFSAPRYSSRSLLPRDPPPFSIAGPAPSLMNGHPAKESKSHQPNVSLADYPLPDGNWQWASKEWMIDMRNGTVQHDGFEYNWVFRETKWRNKAGRFNAGAWVRRRRWVRLMERPPLSVLDQDENTDSAVDQSKGILSSGLGLIWQDNEGDWARLYQAMKVLGRDGLKLEVWKGWVKANYHDRGDNKLDKSPGCSTPKEVEMRSHSGSPERQDLAAILRAHVWPVYF
ncbi:hypothetical protein DFH11DRAFT_54751 [Phellopilus nigrolimitatus]|nr:hypothetical protein DFH11DRAFT_54751 [Phellopilus nigrolimitatus]